MLIKTIKWPVICLLFTEAILFIIMAFRIELRVLFVASALAPLLLAYGAWVGSGAVKNGGSYIIVLIATLILGFVPLLTELFCFGKILVIEGRGLVGLFDFCMILFGSLIGFGYTIDKKERSV
jgi:hypothetical protein